MPRLEYTTVRSRLGHRLLQRAQYKMRGGVPTPEDELLAWMVGSLHASFADEMPTGGMMERLGVFPHTDESVGQMTDIQRLVGPRRAVLYPRQHHTQAGDYREFAGQFLTRSFQPKPRDMAGLWGLPVDASAEDIAAQMEVHGFDDATADTVHSIALAGLVDRLAAAKLLGEVHVSVGRTDKSLSSDQIVRSERAKNAFMQSPEAALATPEGRMVYSAFRHWSRQGGEHHIVLETAPPMPWHARQARNEQQAMLATIHELRELAGLALSVHPR